MVRWHRRRPKSPGLQGNRTEDIGAGRELRGCDQFGDRTGGALDGGDPGRRRKAEGCALVLLTTDEPARVPPGQRLHHRQTDIGGDDDPAAVGGGPCQCRCCAPASQGLLGGPQVRAAEQRPGVEQQDRAVPAVGERLGAWSGDHECGRGRDARQHAVPARRADGDARERAPELLGRPPVTDDSCPQPGVATGRTPPPGGPRRRSAGEVERGAAAPVAGGRPGAARTPERTLAVAASGRATTAGAGQRKLVPAPRHLDEHRRAGGQRVVGRPPGKGRQPRGPCRRIPGRFEIRTGGLHPGGGGPYHRPRRGQHAGPADPHQGLRVGRRRPPSDDQTRALLPGPQHGDVAGVRVGRARFGVQIVPVVPDDDQAEVADRREHGRAGAHHHPRGPAADGQEPAVPFGRAEVGAQRDTAGRAGDIPHRGHDAVDVTVIGHDDQGTPVGSDCGGHGRGHHRRPGRPGKGPPHRSGAAAGGQVAQQPFALGVLRPGASWRVGGWRVGGWQVGGWRRFLFHPGVPGRDGEAEHVGEGSGVAVGDRPGQLRDLGREDRLR